MRRNPIRVHVPPYTPPGGRPIPRESPPPEPSPRAGEPADGVDGLVLLIGGTGYSVARLEPGAALALVRLTKADGTVYHVARTGHGPECDCPAFTFDRMRIGTCKHVDHLERYGLLGPAAPLSWEDADDLAGRWACYDSQADGDPFEPTPAIAMGRQLEGGR